MKNNFDYNGIINVNKEKGYTSQDVVSIVRKIYGGVKAGHTGTLDPDACGVLPVCLGRATRISAYFSDCAKEYKARVKLGVTTDTQDASGVVELVRPVDFDESKIVDTVNSFVGEYSQIPPMYSAIKVNGQRLYNMARKGETIERKPRTVYIHSIKINPFNIELKNDNSFEIIVSCSKGTYIRTLCSDIGEKLGCGAHMSSLVRTKVATFTLDDSLTLAQLKESDLDNNVVPIEKCLPELCKVHVANTANKYLYNGNKIFNTAVLDKLPDVNKDVLVFDTDDNLIGIYSMENEFLKPKTMLIST